MDPLALDVLAAGLSIAPLLLIFRLPIYRWHHPKTGIWMRVLVALGCVALAVGFFWMWQYLQHPVIAYLDAIVYGLCGLQALLVPLVNGKIEPKRRD
jgi:hypothetical protein